MAKAKKKTATKVQAAPSQKKVAKKKVTKKKAAAKAGQTTLRIFVKGRKVAEVRNAKLEDITATETGVAVRSMEGVLPVVTQTPESDEHGNEDLAAESDDLFDGELEEGI